MTRTALALALCACAHATTAVAAQCSVESVTTNFGAYVGAQVNSVQNIRITCSATLPPPERVNYEVQLSPGFSNSFAQRRMQRAGAPPDTLPYNLYLGSVPAVLNTRVWGDGTGGTRVWQGSMTLPTVQATRDRTVLVKLVLPSGQPVPAGAIVTVEGRAESFPVGFDGEAFLTRAAERQDITVRFNGASCGIAVAVDSAAVHSNVGPLTCDARPAGGAGR